MTKSFYNALVFLQALSSVDEVERGGKKLLIFGFSYSSGWQGPKRMMCLELPTVLIGTETISYINYIIPASACDMLIYFFIAKWPGLNFILLCHTDPGKTKIEWYLRGSTCFKEADNLASPPLVKIQY